MEHHEAGGEEDELLYLDTGDGMWLYDAVIDRDFNPATIRRIRRYVEAGVNINHVVHDLWQFNEFTLLFIVVHQLIFFQFYDGCDVDPLSQEASDLILFLLRHGALPVYPCELADEDFVVGGYVNIYRWASTRNLDPATPWLEYLRLFSDSTDALLVNVIRNDNREFIRILEERQGRMEERHIRAIEVLGRSEECLVNSLQRGELVRYIQGVQLFHGDYPTSALAPFLDKERTQPPEVWRTVVNNDDDLLTQDCLFFVGNLPQEVGRAFSEMFPWKLA